MLLLCLSFKRSRRLSGDLPQGAVMDCITSRSMLSKRWSCADPLPALLIELSRLPTPALAVLEAAQHRPQLCLLSLWMLYDLAAFIAATSAPCTTTMARS